jgi:acyl-CoA thioester hydrolase
MSISYKHKVQYYETDQMGIVHHSNYIRWFEESRVYLMEQLGFSYGKTEKLGFMIPVLGVSCEYKTPSKFEDIVEIIPIIEKVTPVKLIINYEVRNSDSKVLIATGQTKHCFVNRNFKPISLQKHCEELFDIFKRIETSTFTDFEMK